MKWFAGLLFAAVFFSTNASKIQAPRIINGEVAEEGQFPWQVGVIGILPFHMNYCAGAIISDEWILTAAHCINGVKDIMIIYDTLNLEDPNNKIILTQSYLIHENFDLETLNNDIGLIRLDPPLELGGNVQAISLAEGELEPDTVVTVSGWGSIGDDDDSGKFDVLRYINVTTIDNSRCMEAYGTIINDGIVCTDPGEPLRNPCRGDAGDPVIVDGDDGPVLVALFSFLSGLGCEATDFPAGYTRVAFHRQWIRELTGI